MKSVKEQVEYLKSFVLDDKNKLFAELIEKRTDYVTIVLEDLYQSHNQAAIMRSADCFGIQDVHLIENRNSFDDSSTVSMGAKDWISLYRYGKKSNNTIEAINTLKERGYRIVATSPHIDDVNIDDFDLSESKAAFFVGTERQGLSDIVLENADCYVKVPMIGFTESLNVSVCAAIIMYTCMQKLHESDINWHLSEQRKNEVLLSWYKKYVRMSEKLLDRFNASEGI